MNAQPVADGEASLRVCPACGQAVQLDADLCPVCGLHFASISKEAPPPLQKPPRWWEQRAWSLALIALTGTVLIVLIIGSALTAKGSQGDAQVATPTPTLPAVSPTPTLVAGFSYYTDNVASFQAQYPITWQSIPHNPGVEFDDSEQNPTYILQILLPTDNEDTTTDWVAYELQNLRDQTGQGDFVQLPGAVTGTIGGELWTGSAAQITQGTTTIAVQVLVTVHEDRVYVINMLAANVSMAFAQSHYFDNILNTFVFLS